MLAATISNAPLAASLAATILNAALFFSQRERERETDRQRERERVSSLSLQPAEI